MLMKKKTQGVYKTIIIYYTTYIISYTILHIIIYITLSLNYNLQDQDLYYYFSHFGRNNNNNNNTLFNLLPWSQTLITLQSSTGINGCHTDTGENTNLCSVILSDGPLFD